MIVKDILFILVSLFVIGCAMGVVLSRSPIYSAFNLVLAFFGVAIMFLLLGSPFLAAIQVLIYTGAIVVLFVFVVMLLNLSYPLVSLSGQSALSILLSTVTVWLFSLIILRVLNHLIPPMNVSSAVKVSSGGSLTNSFPANVKQVSMQLFNEYLWPFEVLSLFLLVLIIGIYVLAKPASVGKVREK